MRPTVMLRWVKVVVPEEAVCTNTEPLSATPTTFVAPEVAATATGAVTADSKLTSPSTSNVSAIRTLLKHVLVQLAVLLVYFLIVNDFLIAQSISFSNSFMASSFPILYILSVSSVYLSNIMYL